MLRAASFLLLLSVGLNAQKPAAVRPLPTFPIPLVTNTPDSVRDMLARYPAMLRVIQRQYRCVQCEATGAAPVALGALGEGAILTEKSSAVCGATGNCMTSVFFRYEGRYRIADLYSGWAYAIVKGKKSVPNIFLEANMSSSSGIVYRFSFLHGTFVKTGCDFIEEKQPGGDIRDPRQVTIQPCREL